MRHSQSSRLRATPPLRRWRPCGVSRLHVPEKRDDGGLNDVRPLPVRQMAGLIDGEQARVWHHGHERRAQLERNIRILFSPDGKHGTGMTPDCLELVALISLDVASE